MSSDGADGNGQPLTSEDLDAAKSGMLEALKINRTDILNAMLKTLTKSEDREALHNILAAHYEFENVQEKGTMLHIATILGQADNVRALLNAGANPALKDSQDKTAYEYAQGQQAILTAYMTSFLQAISSSDLNQVVRLVQAGVDVNSSDVAIPIQWAAGFSSVRIVKALLDYGANVNTKDTKGSTALHDAAQRGDLEIVELLVNAGGDIDARGSSGKVKDMRPGDVAVHADATVLGKIHKLLGVEVAAQSVSASSSPLPTPQPSMPARVKLPLDARLKVLWPTPKRIVPIVGAPVVLPKVASGWLQDCSGNSQTAANQYIWSRLKRELSDVGTKLTRVAALDTSFAHITMTINPDAVGRSQEYRLAVDDTGVSILAGDIQGLHYGITTFVQLLRLCRAGPDHAEDDDCGIPQLKITDFPDLKIRAYMLDVSRNRVPTTESLFELVDLLCLFKYNQLQLYFEHTYEYSKHRVVWEHSDPFRSHQIIQLAEYCERRGIQLVPNQQSFGHFERFLKHSRYNKLAERPEIAANIEGNVSDPCSLCPMDKGSLRLVQDLYRELLPNFLGSTLFHVGFDEIDDLGEGRSKDACEEHGKVAVFLQYLLQVRQAAKSFGRSIMIWADMLQQMPDSALYDLPPDVIACEWGYEESHPFDERCDRLADVGIPFLVCPGTSSWNSFTGRTSNCIQNIKNAVGAGVKHNGLGMLLTDWGDNGHLQPKCSSYVGIIAGGLSWNQKPRCIINKEELRTQTIDWTNNWGADDVASLLDTYVFSDNTSKLGKIVCELGDSYLHTGSGQLGNINGSSIFKLLIFPGRKTPEIDDTISLPGLHAAAKHIKRQILALNTVTDSLSADVAELAKDLRMVADLSIVACHLGQALLKNKCEVSGLPVNQRTDLANKLIQLAERVEQSWQRTSKKGGMDASLELIRGTVRALLGGN